MERSGESRKEASDSRDSCAVPCALNPALWAVGRAEKDLVKPCAGPASTERAL